MISNATIKKMGKLLGMDKTQLDAAIADAAEVDIDIPEVKVFTPDGLKKLEGEKYEAGKTAGAEMEIKEYKKTNNLDFAGKDLAALAQHIESKADTDGRVKALQTNLTAAEQKVVNAEAKVMRLESVGHIHKAIPVEYNGLSKTELQAIAEASGFTFPTEKGKVVPYRDGERVRVPQSQEDMSLGDALKNYFETEKGWKAPVAAGADDAGRKGRGGDNTPAGGKATVNTKRSEIEKAWTTANPDKNLNGMEYGSYFATQVKAAKDAGTTVEMD